MSRRGLANRVGCGKVNRRRGRVRAYLDIETAFGGEITIIGLYAEDRGLLQLVGDGISEVALWNALQGIQMICTYNGSRFDVPVIRRRLGLDLRSGFTPSTGLRRAQSSRSGR